jgi:deoxyadenosine/deoxycytidine kinase
VEGVRGLVVVEGLIGVGKTTLCRILEREWGARLVLEPADDNPFLARFYADPERFAFPAQMFYLANRYAQQQQARQTSLFHPLTVCDYLMAKDGLFAEMTLEGHELALYQRFATLLDDDPLRPDFVVFLDAATETIRSRIARRGIPAEQIIPAAYLDDLRARYYRLWESWELCPVHVVRTDQLDYVDTPADRARMLALLRGWIEGTPLPDAPPPYKSSRQASLFGPGAATERADALAEGAG